MLFCMIEWSMIHKLYRGMLFGPAKKKQIIFVNIGIISTRFRLKMET